jgi:uncharacterized protein (DUF433 family)
MSLEIHQPELERRVLEGIQSGRFRDIGDLLTKALDALSANLPNRGGRLDWSQCPAAESVPDKLGGAWVFRGTRLPVSTLFNNLEDGATIDEITEWFRIPRDQVIAVLDFAARSAATPGTSLQSDAHPV